MRRRGRFQRLSHKYLVFFDSQGERRRQCRKIEAVFQEVAQFTLDVAAEAADLSHLLARQDLSIDAADHLHVATARANGGTFVTADTEDFDRPAIQDLLDLNVIDIP